MSDPVIKDNEFASAALQQTAAGKAEPQAALDRAVVQIKQQIEACRLGR